MPPKDPRRKASAKFVVLVALLVLLAVAGCQRSSQVLLSSDRLLTQGASPIRRLSNLEYQNSLTDALNYQFASNLPGGQANPLPTILSDAGVKGAFAELVMDSSPVRLAPNGGVSNATWLGPKLPNQSFDLDAGRLAYRQRLSTMLKINALSPILTSAFSGLWDSMNDVVALAIKFGQSLQANLEANNSTTLDNSLIYWAFENRIPHDTNSLPVLMLGKAGGRLNTGYMVDLRDPSKISTALDIVGDPSFAPGELINRLYVSILYSMNVPRTEYERYRGSQGNFVAMDKGYGHVVREQAGWYGGPKIQQGYYDRSLAAVGEPWQFLTVDGVPWGPTTIRGSI